MSEPLTDPASESALVQEPPMDAADRVTRSSKEWFARARWLLFSFGGRIDRSTFLVCGLLVWGVALAVVGLVVMLLGPGLVAIGAPSGETSSDVAAGLGVIIAFPIFIWINLAVTFKRLHDFGGSIGTFVILSVLNLIPYVGRFAGLILLFRPGDSGANVYGDGPGWRARTLSLELSAEPSSDTPGSSFLSLR